MTILLAEDSALYRHLITGHFNEWGFRAVVLAIAVGSDSPATSQLTDHQVSPSRTVFQN